MAEETTTAPARPDARKKMAESRKAAYCELVELAEMENSDLCADEEKNAENALETVMRYGSYRDNVSAAKLYVRYVSLGHMLEF